MDEFGVSEMKVYEMDGQFVEYRVSERIVIFEDIVIGSLFYFLKDVFNFDKFILDIQEGMDVSTNAPSYGCSKLRPFFLDYLYASTGCLIPISSFPRPPPW